jgi:hypothetical protein
LGYASGTRFSHAFNVPQLQVGTLEERLEVNAIEDLVARDDFTKEHRPGIPADSGAVRVRGDRSIVEGKIAAVEIAAVVTRGGVTRWRVFSVFRR